MGQSELAFLLGILVRTAVVFFFLVVGVRWTGKRQTGELNVTDLLLVLLSANAVQNAMTRQSPRLLPALVAAGTLVLLGWLLARLRVRHPALQRLLVGTPTVIVERGRMVRSSMLWEGVTEQELMAAVHDQGLFDLAAVRLAVLEIDGTISVIPRDDPSGG